MLLFNTKVGTHLPSLPTIRAARVRFHVREPIKERQPRFDSMLGSQLRTDFTEGIEIS